MGRDGTGRSLKTARAVLQVLRFMAQRPGGVSTDDVARLLDKSPATASYLLNSLCQEGYAERGTGDGLYRPLPGQPPPAPPAAAEREPTADSMRTAAEVLYGHTRQRTYVATVEDRAIVVQEAMGRQGLPKIRSLRSTILGEAHALAVGKVVLAFADPERVRGYVDAFGLGAYTGSTITDPARLDAELQEIRRAGYAVDREEYAEGFCCIAAPLFDADGAVRGALGLSMAASRFAEQGARLARDVVAVAWAVTAGPVPDRPVPDRPVPDRPLEAATL